jgi:LacI family transcriptional regulator
MSEDGGARRRRPPTIYDVAEAAGVAPSTVSRAFSRPGRVKAETAAHIRKVAAQVGYRSNPLSRAQPTGRTRMIALAVADVTNPFHFGIIRGAEAAATEAGYTMVLADAQESARREREFLERVLPTVEGVVLATPRMSDSAIRMIAKQTPTIVLNRAVPDVPSVVTDVVRGTRRAVEHLGELGHDQVTYVAGPEASWTDGMRWRSMRDVAHQLEMRVRRVGPTPPTVSGGVGAVDEFLVQPTRAVVAYNDMVAIGLLRGLRARGVRVPQDVSVVGYDDIFAADLVTPSLTTVAAPLRALGVTAVRNLVAIINGAQSRIGEPIVVSTRLVVRESTGRRTRTRPPGPTGARPGPFG